MSESLQTLAGGCSPQGFEVAQGNEKTCAAVKGLAELISHSDDIHSKLEIAGKPMSILQPQSLQSLLPGKQENTLSEADLETDPGGTCPGAAGLGSCCPAALGLP